MGTTVRVFEPKEGSTNASCRVSFYGDKVVVMNFQGSNSDHDNQLRNRVNFQDEEEECEEEGDLIDDGSFAIHKTLRNEHLGTVIFHIDNTASMKRERRMDLTKNVLKRAIPSLLRQGYQIILNAWSSSSQTKGRIQTRKINPTNQLLEPENIDELHHYLETDVFTVLQPDGRTDLYGSCFQLFHQCRDLIQQNNAKAVYSFVLTDGNHNRLDFPHWVTPTVEGQTYFGVLTAVSYNKTIKFAETPNAVWNEEEAQAFLRDEYASLVAYCDERKKCSSSTSHRDNSSRINGVSLTIIAIGDASTETLSKLTQTLGNGCLLYGITEVNQADEVFENITTQAGASRISIEFPNDPAVQSITLGYSLADGEKKGVSGCAVLESTAIAEKAHHCASIRVTTDTQSVALYASSSLLSSSAGSISSSSAKSAFSVASSFYTAEYNFFMAESMSACIKEFLAAIRRIRNNIYEVSEVCNQTNNTDSVSAPFN